MSGPAEVGVIYDHGIPGTYINENSAHTKRSCDGNKWQGKFCRGNLLRWKHNEMKNCLHFSNTYN